MSIRNFYNNGRFIGETFEAHNTFTIKEAVNEISHAINETTGEYTVKDKNSNVIFSVNSDGTLHNNSSIKQHVTDSTASLGRTLTDHTTSLTDHETRLSNVEGATGISNLDIDNILSNGNDADQNSIINLNSVACNSISIDGLTIFNAYDELKTDAVISSSAGVYGAAVNCETLGVGASVIIANKFYFNSDGNNTIAGNGTSLLTGFRTINNLLTEINTLKAYIEELKLFFVAFKDGVYLESSEGSGTEYNYTELMPAEI